MVEDNISSNESEGSFNEFIEEQVEEQIENILNNGDITSFGDRDSDIIVEMDDITPPVFTYGDQGGGQGQGGDGPGKDGGKIRFSLPFKFFMELMKDKLQLPNLIKEGDGKIKEVSYEFKTFGTAGIILDKKRTFKRALKTSVGTGAFAPDEDKFDVLIRRRDKRFKLPERVEKPRFKAVVFYMGDISYSTYGERLELEKRIVNFIYNWLNYNYGADNVDHRFFVHDVEAHEVLPEDFFRVSNAGGTYASMAFELVSQIAFNEYDSESTNFYAFYFGDGELFDDDASKIAEILEDSFVPIFNRVGVVEVRPSTISYLNQKLSKNFSNHPVVRLSSLYDKTTIVEVIKGLFGEVQNAKH